MRRYTNAVAAILPRNLVVIPQSAAALMSDFAACHELRHIWMKHVLGMECEISCANRAFAYHVPQFSVFELAAVDPGETLAISNQRDFESQSILQLKLF